MSLSNWQSTQIPEGMSLTKKEFFELSHPSGIYEIELFSTHKGECWAIGVPREDTRFIVYGSPVVNHPQDALQIVIQKINRETGLEDSNGFEEAAVDPDEEIEYLTDEP